MSDASVEQVQEVKGATAPPERAEPTLEDGALPSEDAQAIELFFGETRGSFYRSTTGPMLDRAELFYNQAYPCYLCDGTGIVGEAKTYVEQVSEPEVERSGGDVSFSLDARRPPPVRRGVRKSRVQHSLKPGDWCKRCNGSGFKHCHVYEGKEPLDARPTAEVRVSHGYEPSDRALLLYAHVSRQLDVVRREAGEDGFRALELFHGDQGVRWSNTSHGRIFSVLVLTPAARRILERVERSEDKARARAEKKGEGRALEQELTPAERLGVQADLQAVRPENWRRDLFDLAKRQALALYSKAARAWVGGGSLGVSKPSTGRRRPVERWEGSGEAAATVYGLHRSGYSKLRAAVGREA